MYGMNKHISANVFQTEAVIYLKVKEEEKVSDITAPWEWFSDPCKMDP